MKTGILLLVCASLLTPALAQEKPGRSLEAFKAYVKGRLPRLSAEQLTKIAKLADKNGDGKIDDDEFRGRMRAVNAVRSGAAAPKPDAPPKSAKDAAPKAADYLDGKPVVIAPISSSAVATLLLITGDDIAESWLPFAQWKTSQGLATKIVSVRQIARSYAANSIQEKIRLCVRDHIENHGTRWVLLGGDSTPTGGVVPGGHTTVHAQESKGIPTDIVYLSPTNWDADGDGVYGEWSDDREAITYPDGSVGLGRVPVRTAADVAAFTQKVIAYESNYPTGEFARHMVYTNTDAPAEPKVRASWDRYVDPQWDGEVLRFFADETPWDGDGKPGSHELDAANLTALFNAGRASKLHIHGHGHLDRWLLEKSMFRVEDVRGLKNADAYPLITTVSCNTGEYDSERDPSIVESILRAPRAGSVAVVAPIRTGKPHFHDRGDFKLMVTEGKLDGTTMTMTRYWQNGLAGATTGEAIMAVKRSLEADARKTAGFHLCLCELNLLGDPTLRFRAVAPRKPEVEVEVAGGLTVGRQRVLVKTGSPGATVCLWKGQEVYEVAIAGWDGGVSMNIAPKSPGDLVVTVAGAGLNTAFVRVAVGEK